MPHCTIAKLGIRFFVKISNLLKILFSRRLLEGVQLRLTGLKHLRQKNDPSDTFRNICLNWTISCSKLIFVVLLLWFSGLLAEATSHVQLPNNEVNKTRYTQKKGT